MADHPRVHDLLNEARKALALRERIAEVGDDPTEVDVALRGLYEDLGRALVAAVEGGTDVWIDGVDVRPRRPPPPPADLQRTVLPGDEGGLLGPELSLHGIDAALEALDPLDDSTPVIPPEREYTAEEPKEYVVSELAAFRSAVDGTAFAALRQGAPWGDGLRDLLGLLSLPASFAEPDALAEESSKVQWAAHQVGAHLDPLPTEVRTAMIAMLAARAQHLKLRLDSDVGARLSLDRLQRYRLEAGLPAVAALSPSARPETGSWEGDVRGWWALLGGEDA
ncbi:MAG: hypothetical protein R3F59_39125 [Myxococcota bacterium]